MRKTSQDGGDTTSITSGIENEMKKSAAGIVKAKKNSIRRKVQSLSHESDDGVIEPLLQKEKEKTGTLTQSAKQLLSKTKTDIKIDKADNKEKLLRQDKLEMSTTAMANDMVVGANGSYNSYGLGTGAAHNHMNVNIFGSPDGLKNMVTTKSQMLVEIDGNKPATYSASPLIFTTAKIHTDGKTTHMEPVQVTPVPILSTIEGSFTKNSPKFESEKTKDVMPIKIEIKKSDLSDSNMFGNDLKGLLITAPTYGNTIQVVSEDFGGQSDVKQNLSKLSNINITLSETKLPDINKQTVSIASIGKKTDSTVQSAPKSSLSAKKAVNLEQKTESLHIGSLKIDVNKNFEPCSSEIKQSSIAKPLIEQKQLQRQKNTQNDDKDNLLPKLANVHPELKISADITTGVNLPVKSSQNHIVPTTVSTYSPAQDTTLPNYVATIETLEKNTPSNIKFAKSANSSVIAPLISNTVVASSQSIAITTSVLLQGILTSTSVTVPTTTTSVKLVTESKGVKTSSDQPCKNSVVSITSSKIPKVVSVSCDETPGTTVKSMFTKDPLKPVSPNLPQHDKSNKLKTKPTTTSNIVTKSVPSLLTSNKVVTSVSKPALLTSSNKVTVAIPSPPKTIIKAAPSGVAETSSSSGASTNKTMNSSTQPHSSSSVTVVTSTAAITSVTSVTNTNKTTSVLSQPPFSPPIKLVTSASSGKMPNTTISSQITTKSVTTTSGSKPHTGSTKVSTSFNKEQSMQIKSVTSGKSSTTPTASTSSQKPSVLHNQSKGIGSETKKDKLK